MSRHLNILLITQEDYLAGSTYSVFFLARGLTRRGHSVYVAAKEGSLLHQLTITSKIEFLPITIKSRFDFRAIKLIRDWTRLYQIDIINAQSSKDRYITVFARWIYQLKVRIVHTRRQLSLSMGGPFQNLIYVGGTDKVIAVGTGVKASLIKGGIPAKHIQVIFNGTPTEKYEALDSGYTEKIRKRLNISGGDFVIGCIGRRKRQEQLLEALNFVNRPIKIIFVGIDEDQELKNIIQNFKIPHQVYFEGSIPSDLAINYLPLFTASVLCSITEGFSQSLMEAMYLRIPVIATRASGNTDLVEDGVNGFLFDDGNIEELAGKINLLYSDEALRDRLSREGERSVKTQFTIDQTVINYENFFLDLTG